MTRHSHPEKRMEVLLNERRQGLSRFSSRGRYIQAAGFWS